MSEDGAGYMPSPHGFELREGEDIPRLQGLDDMLPGTVWFIPLLPCHELCMKSGVILSDHDMDVASPDTRDFTPLSFHIPDDPFLIPPGTLSGHVFEPNSDFISDFTGLSNGKLEAADDAIPVDACVSFDDEPRLLSVLAKTGALTDI